jgi:DNA-binding Xre family transcriptional regulator
MSARKEENEAAKSVRIDGRRLKVIMDTKGIDTFEDLARTADLDRRTITRIRKLGTCEFEVWNKLASGLGCNPIDLLVTPGHPDPKSEALVALLV